MPLRITDTFAVGTGQKAPIRATPDTKTLVVATGGPAFIATEASRKGRESVSGSKTPLTSKVIDEDVVVSGNATITVVPQ